MEQKIAELRAAAQAEIAGAADLKALDGVRVKFLGKKGRLTELLRGMNQVNAEDRLKIGKVVNEARAEIEQLLADKNSALKAQALQDKLASEKIDVTLPGRKIHRGHLHPLTLTLNRIKEIFIQMGYSVEEGPEVETDYFNFEALNLPKDHPARDAQDSFYITEEILLRTQTSPVQARVMQKNTGNAPIRMIAPGRVYRRDEFDASHSPAFNQCEGLVIDKGITFSDLIGTLDFFCKQFFGEKTNIRLRPSFFPFTSISAEVDISCPICHGASDTCKVCHGSGWLEILGAGEVHPHVLEMSGYDSSVVSGFAFGLGVERVCMIKYAIDDLRLFFENDVRFLNQF